MLKIYHIIILLLCSFTLFAQKDKPFFEAEIAQLNQLSKTIIKADNDEAKYTANNQFKILLKGIIEHSHSFEFEFDSLQSISILRANSLKVYNWVLPKIDGSFEYFAFLQIKKSTEKYAVVELIDQSHKITDPEKKMLRPNTWYGALYYKIIYDKDIGKNYYTVLGWDGNNKLTNKKIIDVIDLSDGNSIKIGAPLFKTKKERKRRIVFEYGDHTVMSLRFNSKEKKIVFDHLVPASSNLKGIYEYYGPSLDSFDAFVVNKGKWIYEENTEIKLDRNIKDHLWNDPKE